MQMQSGSLDAAANDNAIKSESDKSNVIILQCQVYANITVIDSKQYLYRSSGQTGSNNQLHHVDVMAGNCLPLPTLYGVP